MNSKNFILTLFSLIFFLNHMSFAMSHGQGSSDPLFDINYKEAFDTSIIDKNFSSTLEILKTHPEDASPEELAAYQQASLKKLYATRRSCITQGARYELTSLLFSLGATLAMQKIVPNKDAMGNSFSIFHTTMNAAYSMPTFIKTAYNLLKSPTNSLADLEEYFAHMKCFIPETFHPRIIQAFSSARTNQFEQQTHKNFLEFALGLTIHKPKPTLQKGKEDLLHAVKESLFAKVDTFFEDYKQVTSREIWILKNNIYSFMLQLLDEKQHMPRYIYLHGSGGIGKTFLVNKVYQWIDECLPGFINYENCVIENAQELEGDSKKPGTMLCVLRSQLMNNKLGSVIFMDEASWLCNQDMASAAKRVFNGDQSIISTDYFGKDIEGAGFKLAVPPALVFVASNDDIKDQALKTRFDVINFPQPTTEALANHARTAAQRNKLIKPKVITAFDYQSWIKKHHITNFRDAESQIIPTLLAC